MASHSLYAQNVGIGIASPSAKLHIYSADTAGLRIDHNIPLAAAVSSGIYFRTGTWYTGAIKQVGTSNNTSRTGIFGFASSSPSGLREYLSITDAGNVGIGIVNPTLKLEVAGGAIINGNATIVGGLSAGPTAITGTTTIAGNTIITGLLSATAGVFVGNTNSTVNGGIRYNTTNGFNRMEYSESGSWKTMTKPFYQSNTIAMSSATRNSLVLHPSFEYVVPEAGNYFITISTMSYPVFKTNGCNVQYLDNSGYTYVHSKTRGLSFYIFSGAFKWYIVNTVTGCQTASSIPLLSFENGIVNLQKGEIITVASEFSMSNPPGSPDIWSTDSRITLVKVD